MAQLYSSFPIAAVTGSNVQLPADGRILLLGADDKNLVALVRDNRQAKYIEPHYLLRSDMKTFRLVEMSKINDFMCKPSAGK